MRLENSTVCKEIPSIVWFRLFFQISLDYVVKYGSLPMPFILGSIKDYCIQSESV